MENTIETSGGEAKGLGTFVLILVVLEVLLLGMTYLDTPLKPLAILCAVGVGVALSTLLLLSAPRTSFEEVCGVEN